MESVKNFKIKDMTRKLTEQYFKQYKKCEEISD